MRPIEVFRVATETAGPPPVADIYRPVPSVADKPSIAVLAFNNMSGDPEQEYFSDGISEDVITDLSRLSELHVIARNSPFVYKHRAISARATCSKAVCAKRATVFGLPRSSSIRQPADISGPTGSTAISLTSSPCRTG